MSARIKISESQFNKALYDLLSEQELITEAEEITKSDVEQIAKKAVKTYFESNRNVELENKIKSVIHGMVKNDKAFETAMVDIAKNVLVQMYKALWTKRSFWVSDLRNANG